MRAYIKDHHPRTIYNLNEFTQYYIIWTRNRIRTNYIIYEFPVVATLRYVYNEYYITCA